MALKINNDVLKTILSNQPTKFDLIKHCFFEWWPIFLNLGAINALPLFIQYADESLAPEVYFSLYLIGNTLEATEVQDAWEAACWTMDFWRQDGRFKGLWPELDTERATQLRETIPSHIYDKLQARGVYLAGKNVVEAICEIRREEREANRQPILLEQIQGNSAA